MLTFSTSSILIAVTYIVQINGEFACLISAADFIISKE